jgi:DNA-binding PucR family transcriptional regulator
LRRNYLAPLESDRDGGTAAKNTLRAYFAAAGNVSSSAAALGVSRQTVRSRVTAIEDRLGRPLETASAEIQTALRLDEIDESRRGDERAV